jgi:hypothetical protein
MNIAEGPVEEYRYFLILAKDIGIATPNGRLSL